MKTGYLSEHWLDEQGCPAGGISSGVGFCISWQNGPLGRVGDSGRKEPNGAFVENIIDAVIRRLEFYQEGKFECEENETAIYHLKLAAFALNSRTNRRIDEGVEGTHEGL